MKVFVTTLLVISIVSNCYSQESNKSIETLEREVEKMESQILNLKEAISDHKKMISLKRAKEYSTSMEGGVPKMKFITKNESNMYASSGTYSDIIAIFHGGEIFKVIGYKYHFVEVCNDTLCGWINKNDMANIHELDGYIPALELLQEDANYQANQKDLKEQRRKINERKESFKKEMYRLYGEVDGSRIIGKKVWVGMTEQMAEYSWGKPESINRTTSAYGVREQWVYYSGSYLYFDDGILTTIQN